MMKPIVYLLSALCLSACTAVQPTAGNPPAAPSASAKTLLDNAVAAYQQHDYTAALPLFRQADRAGHFKAMRYIGLMYLNGYGIGQDPVQAAAAFKQAADKGDITAQYWLGYLYEHGIGVTQNLQKAYEYYQLSAQRGDHVAAPAMTALGRFYEYGIAVSADSAQARAWYEKSAATGNIDAQAALQRLNHPDR